MSNDQNAKRLLLLETNFWIKILGYDQFELGVIDKGQSIGGYKINREDLTSIINCLKDLENFDFNQNPNYIIYPEPEKLPLYISYYDGKYYAGLSREGQWVGIKEVSLETIKGLPSRIEEILKEALKLRSEHIEDTYIKSELFKDKGIVEKKKRLEISEPKKYGVVKEPSFVEKKEEIKEEIKPMIIEKAKTVIAEKQPEGFPKAQEMSDEESKLNIETLRNLRAELINKAKKAEEEENWEGAANFFAKCKEITSDLFKAGQTNEEGKIKMFTHLENIYRSKIK